MQRFILIIGLFLILNLFLNSSSVYAQDFINTYKAEYFLNNSQEKVIANVKFTINITNLRSDMYVKKMALSFPKSFSIRNVKAADNEGGVIPTITSDNSKVNIQLELTNPVIGKDNSNSLLLEFEQDNLFKVNGNVWEVILPTIEDKASTNYEVLVHLPDGGDKKISIAKPKPDEISRNTIIWKNPKVKTIYAVFGDKQYYKTQLTYHLQNTRVTPVYTDIAFPPDTSYQKIYINSIQPRPSTVFIDEDGNYLGRYFLKPKEDLDVNYSGVIELFNQVRPDNQGYIQQKFNSSKNYLLTPKSYWQLGQNTKINLERSPQSVFNFVTDKLTYNYERAYKNIKRLGAAQALTTPNQAVCVEFADTFIALAREMGIYSREIQGYGFSNDPQLRPLSLLSDILHSWPEYYDLKNNIWVPIDPTWESTSGIDYFNSFDLNHIVFAIHGKRADYPLPAGSYKIEDTKDLSIEAVSLQPSAQIKIELNSFSLPSQVTDSKIYTSKIVVTNSGNIFLYEVPLKFISDNLQFIPESTTIGAIAPYEKKEVNIQYKSKVSNKKIPASLSVTVYNDSVYTGRTMIVPYYYDLGLKVGYIIIFLSSIGVAFKIVRGLKRKV